MKAGSALLLLLLLVATGAAQDVANLAGTYELLICERKSKCNFENPQGAFTRAIVVISSDEIPREEINRIDRFARYESPARVCYRLEHLQKSKSYVQITHAGVSGLNFVKGLVEIQLFRSPDAGYWVSLKPSGTQFDGTGRSSGVGAAYPGPNENRVVGRRIGQADRARCLPVEPA